MKQTNSRTIYFFFALCFLLSYACNEEGFINSSGAKLRFSKDTVLFDTVFTTVGSVTKSFKIYNDHDKKIKVSEIRLAGGKNSDYRINVDGKAADKVENKQILPN
ncbi:MAG: hypothetical protein ABEH43_09370, partial [Flavobacteriales bacterium]